MDCDTYILNFNPANNLIWATYFGNDAPFVSPLPWLYFADWGAAITTYKTDDLYIVGYSGCGDLYGITSNYQFPWANPGGGAFMQYSEASKYAWNAFISKFGLSNINVGEDNTEISESPMTIYPNPAHEGIVNVTFPFITNGDYSVYNILGDLIGSGSVENSNRVIMNTNGYGKGSFLIRVKFDYGVYTGKFIKY